MSRNEINLDQIERRLGSHGGGDGFSHAFDTPFSVSASEGSHPGSILNSGFIATVFATFMLVGSGSFFFMGEQLPDLERFTGDPGIASVVDPTCGGSWRSAGNNVAAMSCYLTTQPQRFCDPAERKKLRLLFVNYRTELAAFAAKEEEKIAKLRVKSVESGIDGSVGMFDMLGKGEEGKKSLKSTAKSMKRMKRGLKKKGSAAKAVFNEALANQEKLAARHERAEEAMVGQVKALIESGYLQGSDIGWLSDQILRKGYDEATYSPDRPCGT